MNKKNLITVVCYDQVEYWHSRKNALDFYRRGILDCEGSERDRYVNVYLSLEDELDVASDGCSWPIDYCELKGWVLKVGSPDGTRDYGGKIWYPID